MKLLASAPRRLASRHARRAEVERPTSPRTGPARRIGKPTEAEAWALLLTVTGLGPAGLGALLSEHGGGRAILAAAIRPGA
ncbi:MAG: hypothetical protein QOI09_1628, partial [Chloroflexota bacterium]|nr:hypothetical protein [Chloroflexota bacterium]